MGPSPQRARAESSRWRRRLVVGAIFVVAEAAMVRRTPDQLSHHLLGNLSDPSLIIWTLRWDGHAMAQWAFLRHPLGVFQANIFSPAHNSLAYADDLLAVAPVYNALFALTHNWTLSLNLLWLGEVGLNLGATHSLARWLTGHTEGAVFAGLAAGFSGFVWSQTGHQQLQTLGLIPLGLLVLFKVLERPRPALAVALGAVNLLILLSALYWAAIYTLSVLVVLVGWFLATRARPDRHLIAALAVAGAITLVAAPTLVPYHDVQQTEPVRPLAPYWSLHARDLVRPAPGSYLYPGLAADDAPGTPERHDFPGFLTMGLALVGLIALAASYRRPPGDIAGLRRRELVLLAVVGLVGCVLAIGAPGGLWTPWRFFYEEVPGFKGIRVTARLAAVMLLAAAVLAGAGLDAVLRRLPGRAMPAAAGALACVVVLAELAAPLPWVTLPSDPATLAVYRALAHRPPGVVLELPMTDPATDIHRWSFTEPVRMVWATLDWHPRVNGYSGYYPPSYPADAEVLATLPSPAAEAQLRHDHVRYLVVHVGEQAGWAMYTPAQASVLVSHLGSGAAVTRYGPNYLVDLGPAAGSTAAAVP